MSDSQRRALHLVALGLVAAAILTVGPYWVPVLVAAWGADLLQPSIRKLERTLGGRRRGAAAAIVVLVLAAILVPVAGTAAAVVVGVRELLTQLRAVAEGKGDLAGVLLGGTATPPRLHDWADLLSRHGADAWRGFALVARTSASALLDALVFVTAFYALAAGGGRGYRWLARHSPLAPRSLSRLMRAFRETGRGLIIGGGGTALVQGLVATVLYVALGIPRALLLGPITAACALVPVVGTGLVWVPLAIELALTGDYVRAGVLAVGGGVLGTIDNLIRPVLTKRAQLKLPTSVVLVSILGGVSVFGAAGAFVGPLVVRFAVEALAIVRATRRTRAPEPAYAPRQSQTNIVGAALAGSEARATSTPVPRRSP